VSVMVRDRKADRQKISERKDQVKVCLAADMILSPKYVPSHGSYWTRSCEQSFPLKYVSIPALKKRAAPGQMISIALDPSTCLSSNDPAAETIDVPWVVDGGHVSLFPLSA